MQDNQDNDDILPTPPKKEPRLLQKTIDAIKLVQAGLTPRDALQASNMVTKVSDVAVSKFKAKLKRYTLNNEPMAHLASNQIKRILKARAREEAHTKVTKDGDVIEYIDKIYPTDSNILAAAGMVYDRYEPVQAQEPSQGQGNTYIDLSEIKVLITQDKGVVLGVRKDDDE